MQFGKFHGIALLALGAILLFTQTLLIFREKAPPPEVTAPSQQPAAAEPNGAPMHGLEYLSGVMGVALLGAGAYLLARSSHKTALQQAEQERREEDRSAGLRGHHVSTPTIWKER